MPNLPHHTNITVNDYSALKDANVIISALGNIKAIVDSPKKNDRFAKFRLNTPEIEDVGKKIKASGFHGVIDVITNPCDVITGLYQRVTGLPKNQVVGTGTLLDFARMKRIVGMNFHVDPRSVHGYNLGEHGNSQFTAWSTVRVLDQPITKLAKQKHINLADLNKAAKLGGWKVFSGKHCTQYGVATAAVRLANIVMDNTMSEIPVSNYRTEYGTYLSYPVIVGKNGVMKHVHLNLTDDEKKKLAQSAHFIKENTNKLKH